MAVILRKALTLYFLLAILITAQIASAQHPVGTRAEGMAGAFVAVADDASAVYWNPAGIATGSLVSAVISIGDGPDIPGPFQTAEGQQDKRALAAFSATALGVAYYRFTAYGLGAVEPAVTGSSSREEVGRFVHAVNVHTAGVSLLQSLSDHIVVAATPKFVHGLDTNTFDVDAGVMVSMNRVRLGLVARNLTEPAFATAEPASGGGTRTVELQREMRAGVAWGSGWTGISRVVVSMDADLLARPTAYGDRRDIAGGAEAWWFNQRVGVRGGVRGSTIGEARAAYAFGASAAVRPGMLVEAHAVRGDQDEHEWSVGMRMVF